MPRRQREDSGQAQTHRQAANSAPGDAPARRTQGNDRPFTVLSISGGGIRGIIPAVVIAEIEKRANRPAASLFDLIAGTSTGGILAAGLTCPKERGSHTPRYQGPEIVDLYRTLGPKIFRESPLDAIEDELVDYAKQMGVEAGAVILSPSIIAKFVAANAFRKDIKDVLELLMSPRHDLAYLIDALYGQYDDLKLSDAITRVAIFAYSLTSHAPRVFMKDTDPDVRFYQAACATSAAPIFFAPYRLYGESTFVPLPDPASPGDLINVEAGRGDPKDVLVDGGVFANNPTTFAYSLLDESQRSNALFVSIETGHARPERALAAELIRGGGVVQWMFGGGNRLLNIIFDGMNDAVVKQMATVMERGTSFYNFSIQLPEDIAKLDVGRPAQIHRLEEAGKDMVRKYDAQIDRIVSVLTAS